MENELLPCPWCGNKPELITRGNDHTKKRSAEIYCKNCVATMIVGAIRNDLAWCIKTVSDKWNTRKPLAELMPLDDKKVMRWYANIAEPQNLSTIVALKKLCSQFGTKEPEPKAIPEFNGHCPLCGTEVEIHSGDEGTNCYVPKKPKASVDREELINEYRPKVGPKTAAIVANFILEDRRRVCEPLVKLLRDGGKIMDTIDNVDKAIDETLTRAGIETGDKNG